MTNTRDLHQHETHLPQLRPVPGAFAYAEADMGNSASNSIRADDPRPGEPRIWRPLRVIW